jgi:hypothetical protein
MRRLAGLVVAATLALAGCGGGGGGGHESSPATTLPPPAPVTTAPTTPAPTTPAPTTTAPTTQAPISTTLPGAVIYTCGGTRVVEPSSYVLACADAGIRLSGLSWSGWGRDTATATGTLSVNACTPNCAQGTFGSYPATVTVMHLGGSSPPEPPSYGALTVVSNAPGGPHAYTISGQGPTGQ